MMLLQLLQSKNMNIRQCSVALQIPYSTLADIVKGITPLSKTSGEILYKIAKFFQVSMESLIEEEFVNTEETWSEFKSNTLHELKAIKDIDYITHIVKSNIVFRYWKSGKEAEAMYLVALTDYLCRIHCIERYKGFDMIRKYKLKEPLFPLGVEIAARFDLDIKKTLMSYAIPEFLSFNIIEGDIRDVC